jgi:hypothetical protein
VLRKVGNHMTVAMGRSRELGVIAVGLMAIYLLVWHLPQEARAIALQAELDRANRLCVELPHLTAQRDGVRSQLTEVVSSESTGDSTVPPTMGAAETLDAIAAVVGEHHVQTMRLEPLTTETWSSGKVRGYSLVFAGQVPDLLDAWLAISRELPSAQIAAASLQAATSAEVATPTLTLQFRVFDAAAEAPSKTEIVPSLVTETADTAF